MFRFRIKTLLENKSEVERYNGVLQITTQKKQHAEIQYRSQGGMVATMFNCYPDDQNQAMGSILYWEVEQKSRHRSKI